MDKIGRRLTQAMEDRGMKPADLSRKTGISKSSISRYMNDEYNPNATKLAIISQALDVNEVWLLGYDDVDMEREPDEVREERARTIEEDMSQTMLDHIVNYYNSLDFSGKVDLFTIIRREETRNQ